MKPKKRKKLKQYNTFIAVHFLNRHQVFLNFELKLFVRKLSRVNFN